mgnify:CR=1 FL=1
MFSLPHTVGPAVIAITFANDCPRYAPPTMAPTPLRIAQTSSEAKQQHKKNGPRLPERQLKQLERAHELDVRAARLREAEDRRRAARKKRDEREARERAARQQTGVGLATQLIGYSHTQAQLKSGMETFLGVRKRNEEAQRKRDTALARQLEAIAQKVDREPWDDDDADADDIALDLPQMNISFGEQYADDDLDDDSLLQAHDVAVSDPAEPPRARVQPPPPTPVGTASPKLAPTREDGDFIRLHGPVNKAAEALLDKLPEPLIELLSQDVSLKLPDWDPASGLLHKLNPLGLPPHRLRVKVGAIVTLLRHLNTSSQLSKSQHLKILRVEHDRLECLVLDGQLEGTKTFLTRIVFPAKYRNDDAYPFRRVQFPIRVATDYTTPSALRETSQSGFRLPIACSHAQLSRVPRQSCPSLSHPETHVYRNPAFRLPGLPASKSAPAGMLEAPRMIASTDGWDDFLESGTQIARELSSDVVPSTIPSPSVAKVSHSISASLPPLSTQDLDFSIDDLEEAVPPKVSMSTTTMADSMAVKPRPLPAPTGLARNSAPLVPVTHSLSKPRPSPRPTGLGKLQAMSSTSLPQSPKRIILPISLDAITPSQRPSSVSDRPGLKRKANPPLSSAHPPPAKRNRVQLSGSKFERMDLEAGTAHRACGTSGGFGMSTQEAASFFADEEDMTFGSPPIAV